MKRDFIFSLLCAVAVIAITTPDGAGPAMAADWYVDASAAGDNDGTSWGDAYTDLQSALGASGSTDTIHVAEGTYKPTKTTTPNPDPREVLFALKHSRTLLGGYPPGGGTRNPGEYETILSGDIGIPGDESDNAYIVVFRSFSSSMGTTAVLDGFTISDGGGYYNISGLVAGQGKVIVRNVTITRNRDGGMLVGSEGATLTNVTFSDNSSRGGVAAGLTAHGPVTLTNVTFSGNSTEYPDGGGGMWLTGTGATATLTNVTFSGNSPHAIRIGAYGEDSGTAEIYNTILWGDPSPIYIYGGGSITIRDSVVEGGYTGTNIITGNPNLGTLGDYGGHTPTIPLLAGSSAIDAANAAYAPDDDQRGVSRPQGHADDIGAYEVEVVVDTPPVAEAGPDQIVEQASAEGTEVTLDGSGSSDPDGDPLMYEWTWGSESEIGVNPSITLPLGTTTVTLVVNDGTDDSPPDQVNITVQDTTPPVLTCPANVTVEQEARDGTEVEIEVTATDICDADVEITSNELSVYPLGETVVTFKATDDSGNISTAKTVVKVEDTTPPDLTVPADITVEQEDLDGTVVEFVVTATDICDAAPTVECDAVSGEVFPLGITTVTSTATDASGNSAEVAFNIIIEDTIPPEILMYPLPLDTVLWPPNHRLVKVADILAIDNCDVDAEANLVVIVTSNEPINGPGDGNTEPDWVWDAESGELYVRAESSGGGNGRIYTIEIRCEDSAGNKSVPVTGTVTVPHDQGKRGKGGKK